MKPAPCPHCYAENDPFGPQRCRSCGLTMLSDQAYQLRQGPVRERILALESLLEADKPVLAHIQPLWEELLPYRETIPFLQVWMDEKQGQIKPLVQEHRLRLQRVLHLAILLFLLFPPLLAAWWQAPLFLVGLLLLPVIGWTWLGVWPLYRSAS